MDEPIEQHEQGSRSEQEQPLLQSFVRSIPDAILILDPEGIIIECNAAFTAMFGWSREEIAGRSMSVLKFLPDDPAAAAEQRYVFESVRAGQTFQHFKTRRINKLTGAELHVSITYTPVRDLQGRIVALTAIYRDVTEQHKLEQACFTAEAQYRLITENMQDLIALLDLSGNVHYASPSYLHVLGFEQEEYEGMNCFHLVYPEDLPAVSDKFGRLLRTGEQQVVEFRYARVDGNYVWVETQASLLTQENGEVRVLAVSRDITNRKLLEEQLASMAFEDTLTGLANRRLFKELLAQALQFAGMDGHALSILHLNLDGFRRVNELHGREAGDLVLRQLSERLTACFGTRGRVCRTNADEFLVMLYRTRDEEEAAAHAEQCLRLVAEPFAGEGWQVGLRGSLGIAVYPVHTTDEIELLNYAHLAMFKAKEAGEGGFAFYSDVEWNPQ